MSKVEEGASSRDSLPEAFGRVKGLKKVSKVSQRLSTWLITYVLHSYLRYFDLKYMYLIAKASRYFTLHYSIRMPKIKGPLD